MQTQTAAPSFWKDANFIRFWAGTVLSALGDSAFLVLLSWFVVDMTGSEGALGTALLAMSLPRLLFMLVGGVAADRFSKKHILIYSAMARGIILALFALTLSSAESFAVTWGIYPMAVVFGIVDAFFWPARSSITPTVVRKQVLAPANSVIETSQQLSMVLGMAIASALFTLNNYTLMFIAVGLFFFASMGLLFFLRLVPAEEQGTLADAPEEESTEKKSALGDIVSGIRYVVGIRAIFLILVIALFANVFIMGPLNIGLPSITKDLGLGGSEFGYLQTALGVGAILGAVLAGVFKGFRGRMRIVSLFIILMGAAFVMTGQMQGISSGLVSLLVVGMMMSIVNIPVMTYIQTVSERRMIGRVMSLLTLMSMGLSPVSYAVTSFVLENDMITTETLFLIGGLGMAAIGPITLMFREFRNMEQHPRWVAAGQAPAPSAEASSAQL